MTDEERRTITWTCLVLLVASVIRFGWEVRPVPPILPPAVVPEALLAETRAEVEREARMQVPLAEGEKIDPNTDLDVELARLPGIGPALAARIVEMRTTEGPYRSTSDLLNVPGIGPATLARIAASLEISDTPPKTASERSQPGQGAGPTVDSDRVAASDRIDVNRATIAVLEELPGIGPALSARIVQHRRQNGPFSRVEELLDVPGIGEATLENLAPLIELGR